VLSPADLRGTELTETGNGVWGAPAEIDGLSSHCCVRARVALGTTASIGRGQNHNPTFKALAMPITVKRRGSHVVLQDEAAGFVFMPQIDDLSYLNDDRMRSVFDPAVVV
jgi:hypothetical protein